MRSNETFHLLGGFLVLVALGGCVSRPALVRQSFTFAAPAPSLGATAANGRVLGVRVMEVSPPYDGRLLVYRTGEFSYERDPYAEFLVPPVEGLSGSLRALLRGTGLFRAVADNGSALKTDTLAEIYMHELYGDFQKPAESAAVLAIRVVAFDAPNGSAAQVLFQKEYARRMTLKARTPEALVAAWNEALKEVAGELAEDLKNAKR